MRCGVPLIAVALVLASATAAEAHAPSKAQYIERADAVCRVEATQLAPIIKASDATSDSDYTEIAHLLVQGDAVKTAALRKLRSLPSTPGLVSTVRPVWNAFATFIADSQHVAADLAAGNLSAAVTEESTTSQAGGFYEGLARGYGFKDCGTSH